MLFGKEQISSSINLDEKTWLYKIKLPWVKRQFESIYYSYEWSNISYWNLVDKLNKLSFDNKIIWISRFNNFYIICFIDLNNLTSIYLFVKTFDCFEFSIQGNIYNIFIYNDFNNISWYISNYDWDDYILSCDDDNFIVKNNIFDTEVFTKDINLDNLLVDSSLNVSNSNNNDYLDVADFFVYDDYFIKSDYNNFSTFFNFIDLISNKNIKESEVFNYKLKITKYNDLYYPKIKINLSILTDSIKNISLIDFRKILLSFFSENISCYLFNNDELKNYFLFFNDFTNIEIADLKLQFKLPDNIFLSDLKFDKFKLDLLKLRYNLYLLRESYNIKKIWDIDWFNKYTKVVKNRLEVNKINLETTISSYENMLWKLLDNIKIKI